MNIGNKKIEKFFKGKVGFDADNVIYTHAFESISEFSKTIKMPMLLKLERGGQASLLSLAIQMVEDAISFDLDRGIKVDCKAGCSHCCNIDVGCTIPELGLVLMTSRGSHLAYTDVLKKQYEAGTLENLDRVDSQCVFCTLDGCSIYEGRPIPCRLYHSKSVDHCIEKGTYDPAVMLYAEAVYSTYLEVLRERDLLKPGPGNVLNRALYKDCSNPIHLKVDHAKENR